MIPDAAVEAAAVGLARQAWGEWEYVPTELRTLFLRDARRALEAAAPRMLSDAWKEGFRACNVEWEQTADIVTPDEDRFVARNPYGTTR